MSLPNYYTILGVPQSADADQIKSAFRNLAKKHHPDKAPENPFAAAHFTRLQEAYEVLSHPGRRAQYDEERWLRGLCSRSKATIRITPDWILNEAVRLRKHMAQVDTYHMNHGALREYVLALLNEQHLSVLQEDKTVHRQIVTEIFTSTVRLKHQYTNDVFQRLGLLAGDDAPLQEEISHWRKSREREHSIDRYRPLVVLIIAIFITALMWWLK